MLTVKTAQRRHGKTSSVHRVGYHVVWCDCDRVTRICRSIGGSDMLKSQKSHSGLSIV